MTDLRPPALPLPALPLSLATVSGLALAAALAIAPAAVRAQGDAALEPTPAVAGSLEPDEDGIIESHGFSTFGTLKYGPEDVLDYVNPDAPKGGEISIWAAGTFDTFNPYSIQGTAGALANLPYETIMTGTADEADAAYCLLCERLRTNANQDFVEFDLRPEARFADGTPVTAHDIVFTVNLFLEQGLPSFAEPVRLRIPSVEALSDRTVRFEFNPDVPRKSLVTQAGGFPVFPQAWFEETGARLDESRLEIPPGSGPYQLANYSVNRRIVFERDPDWWGADLAINQGRHNFERIRIEYFGDPVAAMEGFRAGAYTFRQETSSLVWATGYDFPGVQRGHVVVEELPDGNVPPASGLVFNLEQERFQDPRVREAIGLMYNFEWTNANIQYGLFEQRESFWENSDLAATGVPEGRERELLEGLGELIDPAILDEPVTEPHTSNPDRALDRANLRRALALMEEAGWETGPDGLLRRNGQVFELEFLTSSASADLDRIVNPYITNLRQLGVDARLNRIDPAQFTSRRRSRDFDMIYAGYVNGPVEGTGIRQRYGSEDAAVSVFNPAAYSSPEVDALIEVVMDATDMEEMAAAVRAVDRIMRAERFVIPTYYKPTYWVSYYDMYRRPETIPPYDLGELDFWWHDAEAAQALRAAGALR